MGRNGLFVVLIFMVLFGDLSSASAAAPAKIISGFFSSTVSALLKWLWSLKTTTKTAISGRPMMRFESGYIVQTVFDGSKHGIEPHSVEVMPSGELLLLDSVNNSRPKLVAGSEEGYSGHVDGKPREARMNHPLGLTVDDGGNIYIADTMNMVIRKVSDAGVTTIAGGKWNRRGGHADGPSEDAKFSNDFDVVYVGSSCSLLVIDRGNQAIREIQLQFDDCAHQYESDFPLGVAVLVAAVFFGYMLALLQRRMCTMLSSQNDLRSTKTNFSSSLYQKPLESSVRSPLIPTEDEPEKQEGFFSSLGRLLLNMGVSMAVILGGPFTIFKRKQVNHQWNQQNKRPRVWPSQESFVIPDDDEPPPIETRAPTPQKTYAFMAKNSDKSHHFQQSRALQNGWDGDFQQQQQQRYSTNPPTYYEQSCEKTNEIVFGAVQEKGRRAVVVKAVDYGDPVYYHQNVRPRLHYGGYTYAH